ncbi:ester cyclase [Pseudomonas sp. NFACC04-2]|uniref:ester cyclase n=1 Tax=Pseudomonas TaxID=286 RepID=UPI0035308297
MAGDFLGLAVHEARISFAENVFYAFEDSRIREVWSSIDKQAIEALPENQSKRQLFSTSIIRRTTK